MSAFLIFFAEDMSFENDLYMRFSGDKLIRICQDVSIWRIVFLSIVSGMPENTMEKSWKPKEMNYK